MSDTHSSSQVEASESPLGRLFLRKDANGKTYIDGRQFLAGERLRKDYETAHMAQRVTSAYEESSGSGGRRMRLSFPS